MSTVQQICKNKSWPEGKYCTAIRISIVSYTPIRPFRRRSSFDGKLFRNIFLTWCGTRVHFSIKVSLIMRLNTSASSYYERSKVSHCVCVMTLNNFRFDTVSMDVAMDGCVTWCTCEQTLQVCTELLIQNSRCLYLWYRSTSTPKHLAPPPPI